ncbi:hypothetical protein MSAN_00125100 [Mycena sanguinolenta]|uniref:Uncharacterized protein n=1 Tax=Mycena sanguinolenta TaxID=230812 RepID=A0A8H7DLT7_9AGAR|nr:hypothetical protein MSAN_00125100 [Mycena sanguinolenta]
MRFLGPMRTQITKISMLISIQIGGQTIQKNTSRSMGPPQHAMIPMLTPSLRILRQMFMIQLVKTAAQSPQRYQITQITTLPSQPWKQT